ncbi:hypothetical protein CEXT_444461 [Caerostris extrusa]|uniref:Uncharacterized protein n=1 Tax=Caerostris extrusa TaxID=172846 RepID=A0AAV4U3M1_CAEEX|nr:hypothetical protein CEXT_444461 [Caerostris extrusa]
MGVWRTLNWDLNLTNFVDNNTSLTSYVIPRPTERNGSGGEERSSEAERASKRGEAARRKSCRKKMLLLEGITKNAMELWCSAYLKAAKELLSDWTAALPGFSILNRPGSNRVLNNGYYNPDKIPFVNYTSGCALSTLPTRRGNCACPCPARVTTDWTIGCKTVGEWETSARPWGRSFGPGQLAGLSSRVVSSKIPNELYKS